MPLLDRDALQTAREVWSVLFFVGYKTRLQSALNAYCEVAFQYRPFK